MNRINSFGMAGLVILGLISVGCSKSENPFKTNVDAKLGSTLEDVRTNLGKSSAELDSIKVALDGLQDKDLDLRAQYESFKKAVAEMELVTADLKLNREAINQACGAVLADWQAGLDGLSNEKMRKESADRLKDALEKQQDLDKMMQKGNEEIDVYFTTLEDISKYLNLELNEDSVKSASEAFKRARKSGEDIENWIEDLLEAVADLEEEFSV